MKRLLNWLLGRAPACPTCDAGRYNECADARRVMEMAPDANDLTYAQAEHAARLRHVAEAKGCCVAAEEHRERIRRW